MNNAYEPSLVETEAQTHWKENKCFRTSENLNKEKFYCLSMLPYPSGELHMGHVRNYTLGDVISRYQHLQGKNVLQPMGWDAFGLPAENAAIQHQLPPHQWTQKNIKKMAKQFQQLGLAIDWSREISTCDPNYYRWEQWLFLQLLKKGLVYKKNARVNWDPVDKTVLANEQVIDGKGWRSGAPIEQREIPQWFFKITAYAEELLAGLDELNEWPEQVTTMQRHWIGRSSGTVIQFKPLQVFTTRPDTLMGVTYIAIAFDHPLTIELAKKNKTLSDFLSQHRQTKTAEAEISKQKKQGIFSGHYATHPISGEKLPIWITNFVLMSYGTGAVMSVPAHDQRDHDFASEYQLPIRPVIKPANNSDWDYQEKAFTDYGIVINSDKFNGLLSKEAIQKINQHLLSKKLANEQVNYRLRDWGISRQRYWGTPIPIIYCQDCGTVPVPEQDLPVQLPLDCIPNGSSSPLTTLKAFYQTQCPNCGRAARRETDTMDTFVESSWYYARYTCPDQSDVMLDDRAKYWAPVDQYIGGIEHAVMHLLYARFMNRLLRDEGLVNHSEPFKRLLTQGMVLKDGSKMSKSKGNIVAPAPLIKRYGADTVRLFICFAAPPEASFEWSDSGVEGCHRFLCRLWQLCYSHKDSICYINSKAQETVAISDSKHQAIRQQIHQALQQANYDYQRQQFNTVVSACMTIQNHLLKLDVNDSAQAVLLHEGLSILLRLLSPITPHITHCLWQILSFGDDVLDAKWPTADEKALQTDAIEMVVQINGKLRAHITVAQDADQKTIEKQALAQESIKRHLNDKPIKKMVVVPKKLINIVI